ncbi:type I-E CRISPR-associated protein Cas6/Cse3/CasE [Enterobacillus tribolii]|uniref:CRISPR-associated Cse3 family protein n=1 Tax=Enterobacillus tribolii TaxID=1487935 RepID=A0A370QS23_9GAMM|nr:type I-E CRISPR-associated protein Cas6/Cse3/CasE [Enterobacillus tribolii]MBW7983480.1 type I-E CRISPR-associated protein Cas6/Cse3/CasE [Enterobacillus tribolii]RDK92025.1 CRISPR-associated Cse3 family protein [Enterobacillus tribolii]
MYLSRIRLVLSRLTPAMLHKWGNSQPYVAHQWLWQLFPEHTERPFLFREEAGECFYVLSQVPPLAEHDLFTVETKPYRPNVAAGMTLEFQLRANPVLVRRKKRYDVLMDAKFQAKAQGIDPAKWWGLQEQAACEWLARQGEQHGFELESTSEDEWAIFQQPYLRAYDQHRFIRREGENSIAFSSADYAGRLTVTDAEKFEQALLKGIGKSKALGCGLLMVRRSG